MRLNRGNGHGVHNVRHQNAMAKIMHRFVESLQDRTNAYRIRRTLNGFVSVVTGVQIPGLIAEI